MVTARQTRSCRSSAGCRPCVALRGLDKIDKWHGIENVCIEHAETKMGLVRRDPASTPKTGRCAWVQPSGLQSTVRAPKINVHCVDVHSIDVHHNNEHPIYVHHNDVHWVDVHHVDVHGAELSSRGQEDQRASLGPSVEMPRLHWVEPQQLPQLIAPPPRRRHRTQRRRGRPVLD